MSRIILYPYRMYSRSARALARAVGGLRVYENGRYRPRADDLIVNWGNSSLPAWWDRAMDRGCITLNHPAAVGRASNKLLFLRDMERAGIECIPEYTTDVNVASRWLQGGSSLIGREKLQGSGGRDALFLTRTDQLNRPFKLYTKYVKKAEEYRVHVSKDTGVLHVQQKRVRNDTPEEERDFKIRSYDRGWVFCVQDLAVPRSVTEAALEAVEASCLDFGAVDVIYNRHYERAVVLEINTACGLQAPTTLEIYREYIRSV